MGGATTDEGSTARPSRDGSAGVPTDGGAETSADRPVAEGFVVAVVGPTATGKSELALDLAEQFAAELALGAPELYEIVSADAAQLYRGMDIGTAKLPADQRRGLVHHQIDVLSPSDVASVAAYQRAARADMDAIIARGRRPVVVGGSGLYLRALLDDVELPPTDPDVRTAIEERAERIGAAALFAELAEADPDAAADMDPANVRRTVRALEVIELTGEPFSARSRPPRYLRPTVQVAIDVPREQLDARIETRANAMVAGGLVEETRALDAAGLGRTAARAVGYVEALAHLRGELPLADLPAAIARSTRRLARRQETWFRRDTRITWVPADPELVVAAATVVGQAWRALGQP
ncbi:tRNA (adenosine(37)-N6)-dimethylallyltransferase MiaA [Georgenia sp. Z1491]|uniref:tRNA (adenosine(37)-N6)-dimethylallyltransferase MiaA n=1 Tax=Georgenia sp. Z1491 TaxID=3416707 RepID=UPI003CF3A283